MQTPEGPLICTACVFAAPQSSSTWRTVTPNGYRSLAAAAGPPSPEKPSIPDPATVETMPSGPMRRMR